MTEAMSATGNASSLHTSGRLARRRVEESREAIAAALGARPGEVIFTSGGTESDNLAVAGLFRARVAADLRRRRILASRVEHHAVHDAVEHLVAAEGARVTWLDVDDFGRVHADTLAAAIAEDPTDVAVISVLWANNEVGTVNPIRELAEVAARHDIPFHTDAVQAVGQLPVDFARSGATAITVSGHKIGAATGSGLLLLERGADVVPLQFGGGHERGLRSGTLDVPGSVGLAVAVQEATRSQPARAVRLATLRDRLIAGIADAVPDVVLTGDPGSSLVDDGPSRLPGNAHLRFPDCVGDSLLMLLDAQGIECSTGSACTSGLTEPSHVLLGMGIDAADARSALRFSFGHTSSDADVQAVLEVIEPAVARSRAATLAGTRRR